MSRLTLKNLKSVLNPATGFTAYTASVYFDGKRIGTAENRGTGGSANFWFTDPSAYSAVEAWVKANPIKHEDVEFNTTDEVLDYQAERMDIEKGIRTRLKRSMTVGIMFKEAGADTELTLPIKISKGQTFEAGYAWLESKYPGCRIFNKEPLEDVVTYFMKIAGY